MRNRLVLVLWMLVLILTVPLRAERNTPLVGTPLERLRELVRAQGTIVVIVTVALDEKWTPDGKLTAEKRAKQHQELREKKDRAFAKHPRMKLLSGRDYASIPTFAATVDEQALEKLAGDKDIVALFENRIAEAALAQSIPIVDADLAWNQGYSGSGQVIAVIDTGVERTHRFLTGRVVGEACFNTTEGFVNKAFEQCPNVNLPPGETSGSVDEFGTGAARPCTAPDGSVMGSGCDHGTRVSGMALGRDDGTVGFSGVAKDASLYAINVASIETCHVSICPTGWINSIVESDMLAAMQHIFDVRASYNFSSVNLSLRLPPLSATACDASEPTWANLVDLLDSVNIAVVAATANDSASAISVPACIGNAIAVAATTDADAIAHYSNMAPIVDLLAPGGDVSGGPGFGINSSIPGNQFAEQEGTSFAAPHVAGAIAILKQRSPTATVDTLLSQLVNSGVSVTDTRPGKPAITKPRIDIDGALSLADTQPPTSPSSFLATAISGTAVSLAWNASTDNVAVVDYVIQKRQLRSASWSNVATVTTTSFTDSPVTTATMYAYRVIARDAAQNEGISAIDYATTVVYEDDPIHEMSEGGTGLRGIHIARLRQAVDFWRTYAELPALFTYEAATGTFSPAHLNAVVSAFNEARSAMDLVAFTYSGVPIPASGVGLDDDHVQQLRNSMK